MSPVRSRKNLRRLIRQKKDRPCIDCGRKKHYSLMTFDHVRGEKLFNIGEGIRGRTEEEILAEIAKTEIRCVDCHKIAERRRNARLLIPPLLPDDPLELAQ